MEQQDIINKLEAKGIKPTANRILVLKTLASEQHPLSLSNLEHKPSISFSHILTAPSRSALP